MAAINFPNSPTVTDLYTDGNGAVWQYLTVATGVNAWVRLGSLRPTVFPGTQQHSTYTLTGTSSVHLVGAANGSYLTNYGPGTSNPGEFFLVAEDTTVPKTSYLQGKPDGTLVWNPDSAGAKTVWHSGNDGSGSGCDSDTVDGEHASAIVTEARIKAALANTADLTDTNVLALKQNCDITADGGGAGTLYSTSIKNSTTAAAANMVIDATGAFIQRSTSSRRYKKNIRRAKFGLREVMRLRPVTYQGRGKLDGDKVHGGLIAEEVFEAGLPEFVTMKDGRPEALAYGHMVALLVAAIQEQQRTIERLNDQINAIAKGRARAPERR